MIATAMETVLTCSSDHRHLVLTVGIMYTIHVSATHVFLSLLFELF